MSLMIAIYTYLTPKAYLIISSSIDYALGNWFGQLVKFFLTRVLLDMIICVILDTILAEERIVLCLMSLIRNCDTIVTKDLIFTLGYRLRKKWK